MEFRITHTTSYAYEQAAAEAYGELRLTPPNLPTQTVLSHTVTIDPETRTSAYHDYFGNEVHFFSLPFRHKTLQIANRLEVRTHPVQLPPESLDLSVQEARQIFSSAMTEVFDYLQPTEVVKIGKEATCWAKKYLRGDKPLGLGLQQLNTAIFEYFAYRKGATDNSTPLLEVWRHRKGVCQDFVHIALSVLRTAGLPARYVCGYIETDPPRDEDGRIVTRLIGAIATHAWVEVLLPGQVWAALDPTNNQWCGERHVAMAFGRDFRDATPVRGTFKGSGGQKMSVKVFMRRKEANPRTRMTGVPKSADAAALES